MRVAVVGLGVQGKKRQAVAGNECVFTVDPQSGGADFADIKDAPADGYDAALVCTPDAAKVDIIGHLLSSGKHVLVEKPLIHSDPGTLGELQKVARARDVVCYTAYNHRFEPHFVRMKTCLEEGDLGRVYSVRLFYGNGTARLVRESDWRDSGDGVLTDLGSHLLDTILYWFGDPDAPFRVTSCRRFENRAPDHVTLRSDGGMLIQLEASLLSWRNDFSADVYGALGSAHISSLCKWGPSSFTLRNRILPSGRPDEAVETLTQPDPTWAFEYAHFKSLCENPEAAGFGNLENDLWIQAALAKLSSEIEGGAR